MVPIHKHWDADSARLQILQRDKITQLVIFFGNFQHGSCMNIELKAMDVYETSHRSTTSLVRIVDAKFALPKSAEDETRDFICLDMPEMPTEHDDITIGFEQEEGE